MLTPEPMRHLSVAVLAGDLEAVSRAIARVGVLHILDVRTPADPLPAIQPYDIGDRLTRLESLLRSLELSLRFLGIEVSGPETAPEPQAHLDVDQTERRAAEIATEIEALRRESGSLAEERTQIENLREHVEALAPGLPLDQLRHLRYVSVLIGLLPQRNRARLDESLASVPHVITPAGPVRADGRVLIAAVCLRAQREVLERALRSAQLEPVDVPAQLRGDGEAITAQLRQRQEEAAAGQRRVTAAQAALAARLGTELRELWHAVDRERLLLQACGRMGRSERTALITGWVPAVLSAALEQAVRHTSGDRCMIEWKDANQLEAVRNERVPVPILFRNPALVRPFEGLVRNYGLPRYGEIEPTAIVALSFLTMFGFMFGDVGQGLVLFAAGYFIYRRMFRHRDYAVILMECGVFATAFGFLYGSVFGSEQLLPALWLRPMDDIGTLVKTAIAFGIGLLSLGLILNLINAARRRDAAALWERNGLLAALLYWTAVGLLIRWETGGAGALPLGRALLWLAVPISLILLKEPVRMIAAAIRERRWPAAGEVIAIAVESLVDTLDTMMSAISNTATFIRLAAFALSHAGLFLATFSVADAVRSDSLTGSVGAILVIAAGNIVIIGLEGLIVAIQTVRLEYYEFFSKFYGGGGQEYRPFAFGAATPVRP